MKFGQFMLYHKWFFFFFFFFFFFSKIFIKSATWKPRNKTLYFYKECDLDPCVHKILSTALENKIYEVSYLYQICKSKTIKVCPNQHADLLRFLFTYDSSRIEKGVELVSRLQFSNKFLMKLFSYVKLHKLAKFITRVFTLQVVQ